MTTIVLPIEIEPGVDMFEQLRHMTDDEFYYFCQENANLNFERDASGNIKPIGQTGGETGRLKADSSIIYLAGTKQANWAKCMIRQLVFDYQTGLYEALMQLG